jgi:hypothetical protein
MPYLLRHAAIACRQCIKALKGNTGQKRLDPNAESLMLSFRRLGR